MNDAVRWLLLVIVVGGIVATFYYYHWQQKPLPPIEVPPPQAKVEPVIRHPIEPAQPAEEATPLPPLDDSDQATRDALANLLSQDWIQEFFQMEDIVRRIVVTIDNLPRRQVPLKYMPVKPTGPQFLAIGEEEPIFLNPDNYRRYTPYVRLAEAVETKKLVKGYVHFYPLFQQAYKDLGYPSAYFNDRLVEVIDNLLAAPDIKGPVKLVRPKVMYQFADPKLEARSAGQKILIRMGSENAGRIKAKLHEIRRELTDQAPDLRSRAAG
jgi:hypothetical protein